MEMSAEEIKKILLEGSYVTQADIRKTEEMAVARGVSLTTLLLEEGLMSKDLLGQAIAESLGVPYSDLNSASVSPDQVKRIPEEIAKKHRAVVFSENQATVVVATDAPRDESAISEIAPIFAGKTVVMTYSLPEDIESLFIHYKKSLETRFSKLLEKNDRVASGFLEEVFEDAVAFQASDIHFEPNEEGANIRFRVDGVLQNAGTLPKEYYDTLLNRIKVKSSLRIDEHFSAQDGSLRYEKDGRVVDMRTSIIPTVEGEKAVLRVLSAYIEGLSLADIGLSPENQTLLQSSAKKPFGMILVVGPTGSGKTTTLYSLLKILNSVDANVTTIEDPVEYKMKGVNQIQVNVRTNLTFAQGLRSIVRQDPDTILVGEIRDRETAEIAVNAALTGHLLLSTFHANDAATALPRLIDMGIEPFLLASTLDVVVAQRLVRKICAACRSGVSAESAKKIAHPAMQTYFSDNSATFYEGKGCAMCGGTGYKGRTAIFECIRMTPTMQDLIVRKPSTQEIWKLARKEGSLSLFEDGVLKVKNGVTTIEELFRVAEPPNV